MNEALSPLQLLRAVVGVEPVDAHAAVGRTDFGVVERGGLFGGQMISQSLAACAHTSPEGSVPDSIHANLLAGGSSGDPIEFRVERVRDGRALQHRDVRGYQGGSLIVQAAVVSSIPADGADWQAGPAPSSAAPNDTPEAPRPWAASLGSGAFDVLHPDGDEADVDSWHPLWMRAVAEVPDDPWLHGAIVAFWSDYGMNGAVRVTQEEVMEPRSSVSATHSVWIHRRPPAHDWHLLDAGTHSLSGNQGFVQASLHHWSGALVASIAQGVFIRRPRR
jgi:acyl-CoA thioesterase-2